LSAGVAWGATLRGDPPACAGRTFGTVASFPDGRLQLPSVGHQPFSDAPALLALYNQRARAELIIRELKDAYALGKIPTRDFTANESFFQIVLLAYNLLNWFKRLRAPAHLRRATLQRLRRRLFLVPSQLVRPGDVPTLRLAPSYPYAVEFLETLRRICRLHLPFEVV
jgi:hypothetical protein